MILNNLFEPPFRIRKIFAASLFCVIDAQVVVLNEQFISKFPPGIDYLVGIIDAVIG
jgi:hypothetical protein